MERQERRKKNEDGKSTATAVPFRRPRSSFFILAVFLPFLALLALLAVDVVVVTLEARVVPN